MQVKDKQRAAVVSQEAIAAQESVPDFIGIRTKGFHPLLKIWREKNRRVPWTCLLRDSLKKELATLAGKRYAPLVDAKEVER